MVGVPLVETLASGSGIGLMCKVILASESADFVFVEFIESGRTVGSFSFG